MHRYALHQQGPNDNTTTLCSHSQLAQSMFIGVICFVSGSGWFVSTQEGLWGNGGNGEWVEDRRANSAAGEWVR